MSPPKAQFHSPTSPHKPRDSHRKLKPRYWIRRALVVAVGILLVYGLGNLVFAASRSATKWAKRALAEPPTHDVVVIGGTPSGVAAALSAARHGSRVLLVEDKLLLGGDITYAHLNQLDVPLLNSKTNESPVAYGIFGEFFKELGVAFDVRRAERLFERKIAADERITLWKGAHVKSISIQEKSVKGAEIKTRDGKIHKITAPAWIDATNDASFAARSGASYSVGREIINPDKRMQSAGLFFTVKNVDWNAVRAYCRRTKKVRMRYLKRIKTGAHDSIDVKVLNRRRAIIRLGGTHGNYAWERGDIIKDYRPKGPDIVVWNINFGRQSDGSVVLNTLNICGVNGLSEDSMRRGMAQARAEIPRLMNYLRIRMPGFERARLKNTAPALYIRETRHINGFSTLTVPDVKKGRKFFDRVALASYPLDLHPYFVGDENQFAARRYVYSLPLGALIPRTVNGVFVASRSLSATYSAAGSARVIPITMAMGEAAGVAAWMCGDGETTPHEIVKSKEKIAQLQAELRRVGMRIGDDLKGEMTAKAPPQPKS